MISDYKQDPFIRTCLEVPYEEWEDNRWASHFEELAEIDSLRRNGKEEDALSLCLKGLQGHPDSFLFYLRAADLYDGLRREDDAERILQEGLKLSLSKCGLCAKLADRALKRRDYRSAVQWWIRAGVLQLASKILVDMKPFLNLAYVCQPIGLIEVEQWLLSLADRASRQGPVRFNAEGADLRHQVARGLMAAGDDAAQYAVQAFYEQFAERQSQPQADAHDHDGPVDFREELWEILNAEWAALQNEGFEEIPQPPLKEEPRLVNTVDWKSFKSRDGTEYNITVEARAWDPKWDGTPQRLVKMRLTGGKLENAGPGGMKQTLTKEGEFPVD